MRFHLALVVNKALTKYVGVIFLIPAEMGAIE